MEIIAEGVVVDQYGDVLLILRDDIPMWTLPGGRVEAGELPTTAVSRIVEAETGLKSMPIRLVGLYHLPEHRERLVFVFRCIRRGGELHSPVGHRHVGYYDSRRLPAGLPSVQRERLNRALAHSGGAPVWSRQHMPFVYRAVRTLSSGLAELARRRRGFTGPLPEVPACAVIGKAIVRDEAGRVLLVQPENSWKLPGERVEPGESPWFAAMRAAKRQAGLDVALNGLSGVYADEEVCCVTLCFTAEVVGGRLEGDAAFTAVESALAKSRRKDAEPVGDAVDYRDDRPTKFGYF